MDGLYEADTLLWSTHQAALLRRRAAGKLVNESDIDWANVAEEIEHLGNSLRRELASRISTILIHLMKLQASPATDRRRGWVETILQQRGEIPRVLKEAPSLRPAIATVLAEETDAARKRTRLSLAAFGEQPLVDIDSLTFTEDQVLGDWFPVGAAG